MPITRQVITTTAQMYELQETAKRIYGESYGEKVKPWMEMVAHTAKCLQCSNIQASLTIANPDAGHGMTLTDGDILLMTAALVELAEPTSIATVTRGKRKGTAR